jgi:MSHA biogenesis protein MshP
MKKQMGFSLVSAIFIVVILSLIGSYIVGLSALTNATINLSGLGVKAYYAAKSGLEWGAYTATPINCPLSPAMNSTTLSFTQGGLAGLSATVSCTSNSFTEHGTTYRIFQINAIGQYAESNNPDYVSRQLYMTLIQPGM